MIYFIIILYLVAFRTFSLLLYSALTFYVFILVLHHATSCGKDPLAQQLDYLPVGEGHGHEKFAALYQVGRSVQAASGRNAVRGSLVISYHAPIDHGQGFVGHYGSLSVSRTWFYNGDDYGTYRDFFPRTAEVRSMEISCLPEGKVEDGKVR